MAAAMDSDDQKNQQELSSVAEMGDRARAKWAEKCVGGLLCPFPWGELAPI